MFTLCPIILQDKHLYCIGFGALPTKYIFLSNWKQYEKMHIYNKNVLHTYGNWNNKIHFSFSEGMFTLCIVSGFQHILLVIFDYLHKRLYRLINWILYLNLIKCYMKFKFVCLKARYNCHKFFVPDMEYSAYFIFTHTQKDI